MKKFFVLAVLIILGLMIVLACSGFALVSTRPFRPGDFLFPMENLAEQAYAFLITDASSRALYYIELADERSENLRTLKSGEAIEIAFKYINLSLDDVIQAVDEAPEADRKLLKTQLLGLLERMETKLKSIGNVPANQKVLYSALTLKINTIRKVLAGTSSIQPVLQVNGDTVLKSSVSNAKVRGEPTPSIDPHAVEFPPGSFGAQHLFYPLIGQHAVIECTLCHVDGRYSGTTTRCEGCHVLEKPLDHFVGDCAACHSSLSWTDIHFDHGSAGNNDCISCHNKDKPRSHFEGQCSACHDTANWANASFNHAAIGAKDCLSCHKKDEPSNHYQGQCSACHNTSNWNNATFNHEAVGAKDCLSCHGNDKPRSHFDGQCSACHNTSNWRDAHFNHEAAGVTDCIACHNDDRPDNHFDGQCSACHNTSKWGDARFDHGAAGATDCKSCHNGNKPDNHSDGQCSACHNTSNWGDAHFDHDASGATDCISCHSNDRPDEHSQEQCSVCHNTAKWGDAEGGEDD